ncbi:MAG: hypothetical protein H0W17_04180 [Chloroflexi bacterium]|nr:hypothetical protein [Chloroflexota bacterium]
MAASPLGAAWLAVGRPEMDDTADRRHVQRAELDRNIDRLRALLANNAFTAKAPAAVVERERARLVDLETERSQLAADLRERAP